MEVVERKTEMAEEGCTTPRSTMYRIPVASVCPPPPRKKLMVVRKRDPPRNGDAKGEVSLPVFVYSMAPWHIRAFQQILCRMKNQEEKLVAPDKSASVGSQGFRSDYHQIVDIAESK
ncbi:hypothetical protein [Arabidopsis thaliana]|nr:hypothetical protein [Arabidopsis thaliana]